MQAIHPGGWGKVGGGVGYSRDGLSKYSHMGLVGEGPLLPLCSSSSNRRDPSTVHCPVPGEELPVASASTK